MNAPLPPGFTSWTQILIDWAVSRAFVSARQPACLRDRSELAVPLVAEVSAFIREKQLRRRALTVILLQETVTESAHDQAGGPAYRHLREAMETTQERYFESSRPLPLGEATACDPAEVRDRMVRLQSEFVATRARHAEAVLAARAASAREYWSAHPPRGLSDIFFADAPLTTAASRLARIHPGWWGGFFGRLQQTLAPGHPAEGELLDRLPQLRKSATKKTLAAVIEEWRAEHDDRWGWYGAVHYRMLALRSAHKAAHLTRWLNVRAPGFLASERERFTLHADLAECLAQSDPWSLPADHSSGALSEHGPN